jgi:hypothetical protein
MKRFLLLLPAVMLFASCDWMYDDPLRAEQNPDPNHTHADFAVYVDGERMDFSDEHLMSGVSTETEHHDAHHEYLHLHDGVGHVIHRHKPGLTLEEFFTSIQIGIEGNCYTSFEPMADGQICDETPFRLFVNGEEQVFTMEYPFNDLDQILLTTASTDEEIAAQLKEMTDDSCLYSRTCPQRGDPPAENCIADPNIPCVLPPEA